MRPDDKKEQTPQTGGEKRARQRKVNTQSLIKLHCGCVYYRALDEVHSNEVH